MREVASELHLGRLHESTPFYVGILSRCTGWCEFGEVGLIECLQWMLGSERAFRQRRRCVIAPLTCDDDLVLDGRLPSFAICGAQVGVMKHGLGRLIHSHRDKRWSSFE